MADNIVTSSRITKNINRSNGILTEKDLYNAYEYFGGVCPYSNTPIDTKDWHLEHIIPVKMGGTTDPWNCIPVCAPCNLSKSSKHLLDWWDLAHKNEEEYKLEKIFLYILVELNKPRNYQISTIEQEKINKLLEEEQKIEELDEESLLIETDKKLDIFTFLYQLINHLKQNKEYIKGNIDEYITELQQTYNNNTQYERLDIELFKVQNELVLYLKELGVTNHYSMAYSFAHQITSIEETKKNINEIKEYLNTDNIADLLNKNPNILLMNLEYFSSRVEYIVNVLNIPLNILLDKPSLINQIESLRYLLEYCNSINYNFNDIPNYIFIRKKIKDIKQIIEVCKANGIEATGSVFKQPADEIVKIIELCKANGIEATGSVFMKPTDEIVKIIELCKANDIEVTGSVFMKPTDEIVKIIELCKANGIKAEGNVFLKPADEIVKIIEVCKANGIEVTGSVFMKPADEIVKIIEVCKANGIEITGSVFMKPANEIVKIIEVCKANDIEVTGSVFRQPANEIVKIIEVCKANDIEVTGSVFRQPADEIVKIIEVCNKYGIKAEGTIFTKSSDELQKIINVCQRNNIQITGTIFKKKAKDLTETINYLKQNYGDYYLKPLLIVISPKKIAQVFPYLDSLGVLPTVINSASILDLSLDEIIDRKNVLDSLGEPLVVGNRFNSIFGLSKKNYAKKIENLNIESSKKHL